MTNRDIVLEYLTCFCEGDISGVGGGLGVGLSINRPFKEI